MSNGADKAFFVIFLIIVLGLVAGIFWYIAGIAPKEIATGFNNIGNVAFGAFIFVIVVIVIAIVLFIYSKTRG